MKKYECIFIDLDGPILNGKNRHYQCYKDIINKYGGKPLNIEKYWNLKRNMVERNIIIKKSDFQGTYDEFMNMWMETIETKKYLKYDTLKPKAVETLENFRKYSNKIYLVTMRNNSNNSMLQLEELGLSRLFDSIILCSSKRENPKYNALKKIQFHSAIVIGDTEEDTKMAKRLGIKCIGITNGLRERKLLEADYYVDEICNIDFSTIRGMNR